MKLMRRLEYYFYKRLDGIGLAIFRILFFMNLLKEVSNLYTVRKLYYDPVPFIEEVQIAIWLPLTVWMLSLVALILGYKTRIAAVMNYIFILVFLTGLTTFEYHMDYVYTGISFLAIFMPLGKVMSLDRLIGKLKNKYYNIPWNPDRKVRAVYYYVPVFLGLAVVYTDSIFFKFISPMWMRGLGMWLPASMPPVTIWKDTFLLDNEFLIKFLGYLTVAFELSFMFLFWFKRFRLPLLIVGVGLHFGIYLEFPIPYFAWGSMAIYLLMIPISWWLRLEAGITRFFHNSRLFKSNSHSRVVRSSGKSVITTPDNNAAFRSYEKRKFNLFMIGMTVFVLLQLNISLFSPVPYMVTDRVLKTLPHSVESSLRNTHRKIFFFSQKLVGITFHPVFMHTHFDRMRSFAVAYKTDEGMVFLPFIDEDGMPSDGFIGGAWVNWVYRVGRDGSESDPIKLKDGVMRFTAYWMGKNHIPFYGKHEFVLFEKINRAPFYWEPGLLESNLSKKWRSFGRAQWDDRTFTLEMTPESIQDGK